jgi:biotin carboxyl carrier protein
MLFEFKYGDSEYAVNVEEKSGTYTITIGDDTWEVDAREIFPGCLNILKDGESRTIYAASSDGAVHIDIGGVKYRIDELIEGDDTGGGAIADDLAKSGILIMPMPGKIVKVNVSEGDAVEAGQTLVIIESMKMEQNIKTPVAGTVKSVNVEEGQQVDHDVTLVEVEPAEEEE